MDKINDTPVACPVLHPLPHGAQPRLIDRGFLHGLASDSGSQERYGKGKTAHTIHVWWARRPFSAMRTLVFASLCPDVSTRALDAASLLGQASVPEKKNLVAARSALNESHARPPRVLDMFGGGGTIAQEAANLGAEAFSMDSNPMAVFIQKSLLQWSQNGGKDLPAMVQASGRRVLDLLKQATDSLFPLRQSQDGPVLAYLHAYSLACQACGWHFPLIRRPWLSRKKGRETTVQGIPGKHGVKFEVGGPPRDFRFQSAWKMGRLVCPVCGNAQKQPDVFQCQDFLSALVRQGNGKGKAFENGSVQALADPGLLKSTEKSVLKDLGFDLPLTRLPKWSGIVNPSLYGINTHSDFLNPRQRLVLLLLIKSLAEEYQTLLSSESKKTAQCVLSLLSGLVDQLIDWNCRLSMWIPQNEQVGRAFCGPGVAMLWDYAEIDPLLNGPANLWKKLDRIAEGAKSILKFPHLPDVQMASAQKLPYPDSHFDAIVTDPPYYDNIFYSPLADFFYAWKKPLLDMLAPELAVYSTTESQNELVASVQRCANKTMAHEKYCRQLQQALCEGARVLKDSGVLSLVYSHGSFNGWEALVKAFRASPMVITSVQPLCIERKARPRGMAAGAVNTCLVFVARKCPLSRQHWGLPALTARLKIIAADGFGHDLIHRGWSQEDAGLALFAQGVGMLANTACNAAESDAAALMAMESVVASLFPGFKISCRKAL